MIKYFIEFTFKVDSNTYWLPMFIRADNTTIAEIYASTIHDAISENYQEVKHVVPKRVLDEFNLAQIKEYINHRLNGQLVVFDLHLFTYASLPIIGPFTVTEVLEWLEVNDRPIEEYTASVTLHQFPIRVYSGRHGTADNVYLAISLATGGE